MKFKALLILLPVLVLGFFSSADRGAPEIIDLPSACTVTVRCAGDFVVHMPLIDSAKKEGGGAYDFSQMLSDVALWLKSADFTVTNVDGVMGGSAFVKKYGYAGYPSFSTPSSLISNLKDCGVDMLTLANNHALDYWYDGLKETVTQVEEAGLLSVGGYRTQDEKLTPRIVDINGILFGFLNYTDGLNQMDKRSALDKEALIYGVDFLERADVEGDIARLKNAGAEVIVCFMHWGIEYRTEPCQSQKQNALMLAEAGADVIIGSHPHVVERAEYITVTNEDQTQKQVLCLYSLGNFLSDQRQAGRDCGMIFDFTVTRDEEGNITVSHPVYRTTYVWRRQTGSTYTYRVVFSDEAAERPEGMSNADYTRMRQSCLDTRQVMSEGCALPYFTDCEPLVDVPDRQEE